MTYQNRHLRWISLAALGLFLAARGVGMFHTHAHEVTVRGLAGKAGQGGEAVAACCCSHGHHHHDPLRRPAGQKHGEGRLAEHDVCSHCHICDFLAQAFVAIAWTPILDASDHIDRTFKVRPAAESESPFWLKRSRAPPAA